MVTDNSAHIVDDGQGQNTFMIVDFYGQQLSSIGLSRESAGRLWAAITVELEYGQ